MMKRLTIVALSLILYAVVIFGASIFTRASGRTLVIGTGRDFYEGPESATFLHGSTRTWEALVDLDSKLRPVPWLACSWSHNSDYTIWKFTLRKNIRFHNGDVLTARHVIANVNRLKSNPKYDPLNRYGLVEGLYAPDDFTVVFALKRPCLNFPQIISYYGSPILHPDGWDRDGKIETFIATGPYKLADLKRVFEEAIVLERNDWYWGSTPPYDRVIFRSIPDSHARLNALLAGTVDAIVDVGGILPHQKQALIRNPDVVVKVSKVATTHYLLFNNKAYPFSNEEFRKWLASAIDRHLIVNAIMEGHGEVAYNPYSNLNCKWVFSLISFKYFPFTEGNISGTARKKPILILLHGGTVQRWPYREMAEYISSVLRSKGFETEIFVAERALYFALLRKKRFHLSLMPFTLMTGDPYVFYSAFLHSRGIRNTGWSDPCVDRLIERANATLDINEKRVIYRYLQRLIATKAIIVPLFHEQPVYAYRKGAGPLSMDVLFRPVYGEGA